MSVSVSVSVSVSDDCELARGEQFALARAIRFVPEPICSQHTLFFI